MDKLNVVLDNSMKLHMGPQHPSTHGVMQLVLEVDGEDIKSVKPNIGFLHRGVEKILESKNFNQCIPFFDRLDYACPLINEHVWCLSLEKILGVDVPERAQYIRVIFAELNRVSSHLLWLGTHALDIGAMSVFLYAMQSRERILEIYKKVSGNRMHSNYFRVGGVKSDIDYNLVFELKKLIKEELTKLEIYDELLTENPIWKQRTQGIGVIDAEEAIKRGFSGPMLRGSGVAWDIRKSQPYEIYESLEFDIPVGKFGDCYSRYLVRLEEIKQSFSIVMQCLEKLPKGEYINSKILGEKINKKNLDSNIVLLIEHLKANIEGIKPEKNEFNEQYLSVESPKGELGVFLVTDGSNKPYRCKVRSPSFTHLQSIEYLSKGHKISDLVAIIGSLDVIFGEIDR